MPPFINSLLYVVPAGLVYLIPTELYQFNLCLLVTLIYLAISFITYKYFDNKAEMAAIICAMVISIGGKLIEQAAVKGSSFKNPSSLLLFEIMNGNGVAYFADLIFGFVLPTLGWSGIFGKAEDVGGCRRESQRSSSEKYFIIWKYR